MSDPPDNTPDYVSDNWYLKDLIPEEELKDQKFEDPQTTRDFVNYIQKNGSEQDKEALLTVEAEFTQKILQLVQNIRKQKSDSSTSDGPSAEGK